MTQKKSRTKERIIKIGNTFSVLQEDVQEFILEKQQLTPITKVDKKEKNQRNEKREIGKIPIRKGKSEMIPIPRLLKIHTNKGTQTKNIDPINCKSAK